MNRFVVDLARRSHGLRSVSSDPMPHEGDHATAEPRADQAAFEASVDDPVEDRASVDDAALRPLAAVQFAPPPVARGPAEVLPAAPPTAATAATAPPITAAPEVAARSEAPTAGPAPAAPPTAAVTAPLASTPAAPLPGALAGSAGFGWPPPPPASASGSLTGEVLPLPVRGASVPEAPLLPALVRVESVLERPVERSVPLMGAAPTPPEAAIRAAWPVTPAAPVLTPLTAMPPPASEPLKSDDGPPKSTELRPANPPESVPAVWAAPEPALVPVAIPRSAPAVPASQPVTEGPVAIAAPSPPVPREVAASDEVAPVAPSIKPLPPSPEPPIDARPNPPPQPALALELPTPAERPADALPLPAVALPRPIRPEEAPNIAVVPPAQVVRPVQVHIGALELRAEPQPAPPAQMAARRGSATRGFDDYIGIRSHVGWD